MNNEAELPEIRHLGIVGAGQMGLGIAQLAIIHGFTVTLSDTDPASLASAPKTIRRALRKEADRKRCDASLTETMSLETSTDISIHRQADLVIEAVTENTTVKKTVYRELNRVLSPSVTLCSNTSSLSLTAIAAWSKRPEAVVGMHFFNPVLRMNLVEIIPALQSSQQHVTRVEALARNLGKTPCRVKDSPGFVANRLLLPMINEAIFCLDENQADAMTIDSVVTLGLAHPMGPLKLADVIGLDTCLSILNVLHNEFGDPKYRPCPLLQRMVQAGYLGRKSGQGFYSYSN